MSAPYTTLSLNTLRKPIGRLNEKQLLQFFATDYVMAICASKLIEYVNKDDDISDGIILQDPYNFPVDAIFEESTPTIVTKFFERYIISLTLQRMISYTLVNDQRLFELQNVTLDSPLSVALESGTPDHIDDKVISYYKELRRERIIRDLEKASSGSPVSPEVTELIATSVVSVGDLSNNEEENLLQEAINVVREQDNIDILTKIIFRDLDDSDILKICDDLRQEETRILSEEKAKIESEKQHLIKVKTEIEKKRPNDRSQAEKARLGNISSEIEELDNKISLLNTKIGESRKDSKKGANERAVTENRIIRVLDCILWNAGLSRSFEEFKKLLPSNVMDIINSSLVSSTLGAWSKLFPESRPGVTGIVVDALPRIENRFTTSTSTSQSQEDLRSGGLKLIQHFLDSALTQFRLKEFADLSNNLSPALALSVFRSLNALKKEEDGTVDWYVKGDKGKRLAFNYTMAWITSPRRELSTLFQFAFDLEEHKDDYFGTRWHEVNPPAMFPGNLDLTGQVGINMMIDLEHNTQDRRMRTKEGIMKSVGGLKTIIDQEGLGYLV